jgi:hypothetical protein
VVTPPIAYKTVVGRYVGPDGAPVAGKLRFIPSTTIYDLAGDVIVPPQPIEVTLDGAGSFTVQLAVTDDPTTSPTGWVWQLSELIPKGRESTFQVPSAAPSTVSFSYLTPTTFTEPQYSYATTAEGAALDQRMTTVENLAAIVQAASVVHPFNYAWW